MNIDIPAFILDYAQAPIPDRCKVNHFAHCSKVVLKKNANTPTMLLGTQPKSTSTFWNKKQRLQVDLLLRRGS